MLVTLAGCRALDLPTPPGAGSIQGTVFFTPPGGDKRVAAGATLELIGTSLTSTVDPATGFFTVSPVPRAQGTLLIRYDADGDGLIDYSRSLSLEALQAGPGRLTVLGEVVLAGNAGIRGAVLRADTLASPGGHGGTSVFTPQGPYLVYTGDNGAFSLDRLPEGQVSVAFFRQGYRTQEATLTLRAGETFSVPTVVLTADPDFATPVRVSGTVSLFGQPTAPDVEVTASTGARTVTASDGTWSLQLPAGVYVFGFQKAGYGTVTLRNVVVSGPEFQVSPVVLTPGVSTEPLLDAGAAPYDAGAPFDAGLPDAGPVDAGTTDAGPPDAGAADAGAFDAGPADAGPSDAGLPDAGAVDAGVPDAGPLDAGAPDAGPVDAGLALVAVIDPLPASRPINTAGVTLNGSNSLGGARPYTFHWTQTRGPAVTLSSNHAVTAATPTFTTPNTPTVLGFTLSIVDAFDAGSAPSAEVTLPVGSVPTATISPGYPTTVYASQQVQLDGAGSTDSSGTGIASYFWTISPAGLVTTTSTTSPQLSMSMPATVSVPQALTISLVVTNGVGVRSTAASATLTLTNVAAPGWSVDAGAGQTVNGGVVVTLKGLAQAPGLPGATFTYLWSPPSEAGATPWLLSDPTSATTSFIAPAIAGPNKLLNFTLTATSTSGAAVLCRHV